ncbi:MAG: fructose-bisphosphatase class I, partial [Thermodesulfobium narugense]
VAAGYVVYGSSTMLMYTTKNGTHGFTLDPSVGSYLLSHPYLKMPSRGKIYSINEGYSQRWDEPLKKYIENLKSKNYSARYIGSMVADVHRTLLKGGVFAYPGDKKNPQGKLRLLYEAAPMSLLIEQAGGRATDGINEILSIKATSLHQRTPVFMGSKEDIDELVNYMKG